MLQDNFFSFTKPQLTEGVVKTNLTLNAGHEIFKGHFPDQPVLPGACMVQMVKEVVESYLSQQTRLLKADNLKFLSFVDPTQNSELRMELKVSHVDERIRVDGQLLDNSTVFFKFKGTFTAA